MTKTHAGLALLLFFTVSQGLRDVFVANAFGAFTFFDIVFVAFLMATLFYGGWTIIRRREDVARLRQAWRIVFMVNLTTAAAWLAYFGALNLLAPSAVNTMFSGISPIAVLALQAMGLRDGERARAGTPETLCLCAIVGALGLLCWTVLSSATADQSLWALVAGLALAAASGSIITAETIYAKQLNELDIAPVGVLGTRFVLIMGIGAGMVWIGGQTALPSMDIEAVLGVCAMLLAFMVLPFILVGQGLAWTSPYTVGVVTAFAPTMVFIVEAQAGTLPSSPLVLAATLIYAAATITALLFRIAAAKRWRDSVGLPT